jgi:CTP:molybdopterin cytidylyltransferase MocA
MTRVIGAVLAAGAGTRMGVPKGELVVAGARLVDRAVGTLTAAGCAQIVAVTRPGVAVPGAHVVVNEAPERGMRSSLELAVATAVELGAEAIAVLLVDTPGITAAAIAAVVAAWTPGRIAVATYAGRRGHPTVMAPQLWRRALELAAPDEGARALLHRHPELVDEVAVAGDPTDLDTADALAHWVAQQASPDAAPGRR